MISAKRILTVLSSITLMTACSGGGGGGGGGDSEPSGDVMKNEPILSKAPTQISSFDNSFYSSFKSKFNANYTDSIVAAYPQDLFEDYLYSEITDKTATCDKNTFSGAAIAYSGNGYPTVDLNAEYENCTVGNSTQSGIAQTDSRGNLKLSVTSVYKDSDPNDSVDDESKQYFIWDVKKSTSGTKNTYTYRSREGWQKHSTYAKQYVAHWLTFTIDSSTTPSTVTASGTVQMYYNDATDGDIFKSYKIDFSNLVMYTSGSNYCVRGTGLLSDGTNHQSSGAYLGATSVSAMAGGVDGLIVCFSKVNL